MLRPATGVAVAEGGGTVAENVAKVQLIVSPGVKMFIRVMHMSRGRPLTSALQEPHRPALQFQRTAISGAWLAWMR